MQEACAKKLELLSNQGYEFTMSSYDEIRWMDSAVPACVMHAPLLFPSCTFTEGLNIDELLRACSLNTGYLNDIMSFKKDQGSDIRYNVVTIVQRELNDASVVKAARRVYQMAQGFERLATEHAQNSSYGEFACRLMRANVAWGLKSHRYDRDLFDKAQMENF